MGPGWGAKAGATPSGKGEEISRDRGLAAVEAVLFLADGPLPARKLAQLAGLADGTKARTLVRALNRLYDDEGRAFRAVEVAGGYQFRTRTKFAPWLRRLHAAPFGTRLSGPALETLAVVAYRQPVLRAQIEAIRGVQCGEVLRQLMQRDLIRVVGRSAELGRPVLYGTTQDFLQLFGLRHLDELPRAQWLRAAKNFVPITDEVGLTDLPRPHLAEEEIHVKTQATLAAVPAHRSKTTQRFELPEAESQREEGEVDDVEEDDAFEDDEFEDDEFEEEDDEEEDEDEDADDEPWEEVDDDEDLDEDDWDDDEDDDWDDDEDDDWDDDEEEDEPAEEA